MGDLNNKTLGIFLLVAIVVSLGGTLVVLSRLGDVSTGYATTATGTVNLTVASSKSITTADGSLINFGTCTPTPGIRTVVNSENLLNTSAVCPALSTTDKNISVRNDGNANGSVTLAFSACAPGFGNASCTFLNSPGAVKSTLEYRTTSSGRGSYTGGCTNTPITTYTRVNTTASLAACTTLESGPTANSLVLNVQIGLANDVPSQTNTPNTVVFTIA